MASAAIAFPTICDSGCPQPDRLRHCHGSDPIGVAAAMTQKPRSPSLARRPDPPQEAGSIETGPIATGPIATGAAEPRQVDPSDLSLDQAMRKDRFRLRRARKRLPADEYVKRLTRSIAICNARKTAKPDIQYPAELPITAHRDELLSLIQQRQVIVGLR